MTLVERLDRYQRTHRRAGVPIAVVYKFVDDQGPYLAALITYYGVVSIFPLLLLASTVLNFVLQGDPELQQRVLDSALGQFPVVGQQLSDPQSISGSGLGLAIGIVGTLYGGLGVALAAQNAMNTIWRIPRNQRPNPIAGRLRSLQLLLVVGLSVLATTVLSAVGAGLASLGPGAKIGLFFVSMAVNAAVFTLGFKVATARQLSWRATARGALAAAVAWQLLQYVGTFYVTHAVRDATATNSVFALVLGLIAWIYLEAVVVVLAVEYNVVRELRLYPRALLTPFTDDVDLTSADLRSYSDQARAQRFKGFQDIAVTFDPRPDPPADGAAATEPGGPARPATDPEHPG